MASSGSSSSSPSSPTSPRMPADAAIAAPATERDAGLRRDIRELGAMLGRTLVRQEGEPLLELVERIRGLIRSDREAAGALLAEVEPVTAIRLVRAFTTYFHLANVAEQVHRGRELAAEVARLGVRPVFTAHPTEAARRTVLYKLRQIAELLEGGEPRAPARLEETIDLLWQTDELRIARPDVVDEARNAVWYLDNLHADAAPHVLDQLTDELRRLELEPDPLARPLAFGTWIGGDRDGNPNVAPDSLGRVLGLQYDHGICGATCRAPSGSRGRRRTCRRPSRATSICFPRWSRAFSG